MPKFPTDEKLRELIVYIANKSKKDPHFGAVKLNKLLYYADFSAYRILGHSITGAEYQHLNEGPAPRRGLPARRALEEAEAIKMKYEPTIIGEDRHRIVPQRKAYAIFSKEQKALVDNVIKEFWNLTGSELSEKSHREFGWRLTRQGEIIHYRTSWLSAAPLTEEQIEMGKQIADKKKVGV